jgi:hypothetical protein
MSMSQYVCWRDGLPVHSVRSGWRHSLGGRTGAIPASKRHYPVPVARELYNEAFSIHVTRARFLEIKAAAQALDDQMQAAHGYEPRRSPQPLLDLPADPARMTPQAIAAAPPSTQLMAPATDPEQFIASSIWWHPLIFPTRTDVLHHLLLIGGNGYEWGEDGNIWSVFSHIEPEYTTLESRYQDWQERAEKDPWLQAMADSEQAELARLLEIRAQYRERARTYGPTANWEKPDGKYSQHYWYSQRSFTHYTLLGTAPENVAPAWQAVLDEARLLFAVVLAQVPAGEEQERENK